MNSDTFRVLSTTAQPAIDSPQPDASPRLPVTSVINLAATPCSFSDLSDDENSEPPPVISLATYLMQQHSLLRAEARSLLMNVINGCKLMQTDGKVHFVPSVATIIRDKGEFTLACMEQVQGQNLYYRAIEDFYFALVSEIERAQSMQPFVNPIVDAIAPPQNTFYLAIHGILSQAKASAKKHFQESSIGYYSHLNQQLCQPVAEALTRVSGQQFYDVWEAVFYQGVAAAYEIKAQFALSSSHEQDWINLGMVCQQVLANLAEPIDYPTPQSEQQCRALLDRLVNLTVAAKK